MCLGRSLLHGEMYMLSRLRGLLCGEEPEECAGGKGAVAVAGIWNRDGGGQGVVRGSEKWREVNGIERDLGGIISKTLH